MRIGPHHDATCCNIVTSSGWWNKLSRRIHTHSCF